MRIVRYIVACLLLFPALASAQLGNWSLQATPSSTLRWYDIDMYSSQYGIIVGVADSAKGETGVYQTFDGGFSWQPVPDMFFDPPLPPWVVWRAVEVIDENVAIVAGDSAMIYRTTDGGQLWRQMRVPPRSVATIRSLHFSDAMNGIAVGGDSPGTIPPPVPPDPPHLPYPTLILASTDGGFSWTSETPAPGLYPGDPTLFRATSHNGVFYATGENSLILQRVSAGFWQRITSPNTLQYEHIYTLAQPTDLVWYLAAGNPASNIPLVYRSLDGGQRYVDMTPRVAAGFGSFRGMHFFTSSYGWVGGGVNDLYLTTNSGANWQRFNVNAGSFQSSYPVERMVFTDSLNGWALGGDFVIRYLGTAPKPDMSNTVTSTSFAEVFCERFVDTTITIRNRGTGELLIQNSNISFSSPEFSVVGGTWPLRVPPGRGKPVTLRWRPDRATVGAVTATMTIVSNDPDHSPWTVSLSAKRTYGVLVIDTLVSINQGVCVGDSIDHMSFGAAIGTMPVTFIGFEYVSGNKEIRLIQPDKGTVINGSQTFQWRSAPKQSGPRSGYYRLISGNPACPDTVLMHFTHEGLFTRVRSAITTVDFGKLCIGSARDTVILVKNTGNTSAFVTRRELASGDDVFPAMEPSSVYVPIDSVRRYRLRFAPTQKGVYQATYRIFSDPCADTMTITLKGEGIATEVTFDTPTGVTVGPVFVNRTATRTVRVTNTGQTPAFVTMVRLSKTSPYLQLQNVPPLPKPLAAGEFFDVDIRFAPLALGTIETSLDVAWTSICGDTARLPVTAPCLPNPYIVQPTAMDLGIQPCDEPVRDTLWIRNIGNGPLEFYNVHLEGLNPTHFKVIAPEIGDSASARDSVRLIVEYDRDTEGPSKALLVLGTNDYDHTPVYVQLSGFRNVRSFAVQGDSLTEFFTRLFVPQTRTFTVRNTGIHPLDIADITMEKAGVFSVTPARPLPVTLAPDSTLSFDVVFTPNARGPFAANVRVKSAPCNTTVLVRVNGRGDTDGISLDKGSMDFELDPCVFATSCDTLTISNQGQDPVTVLGLALNQTGSAFAMSSAPAVPFTLRPGEEQHVVICADAAVFGTSAATLIIRSDDPVYPVMNLALSARHDSSALALSKEALDFGRLAPCTVAPAQSVTITNTGTHSETLALSLAVGTSYTATFAPQVTLRPGVSYSFDVQFTGSTIGVHSDTVIIRADNCDRELRIELFAERVDQQYAANPTSLSFGQVNVGSVAQRPVTVQNLGGFDARIRTVEIRPAGGFSLLGAPPSSIPAGGTTNLTVRYAPANTGLESATMCVIFDAPCADTLCIPIDGEGIRGTLVLASPSLSFGTLAQCEEAERSDTLRNTGSGTVMILSAAITGPGLAAFTNLTPVPVPEPLAPGGMRIFRIRYDAAQAPGDGPVTANLGIQTDLPAQATIDIPLDGGRQTLRAGANQNFSLGTAEVGIPLLRTLRVTNTGSVRLCYDASEQSPEITFTPPLPICIDPGTYVDLTVRIMPASEGFWSGRLVLHVISPCVDSTTVRYDATFQRGGLVQTPPLVDIGSLATCEISTFDLRITNSFLVDARLDSIAVTGTDRAFFTVTSPSFFPRPVPYGGFLPITMSFTGQNLDRTYSAKVVSYLQGPLGPITLTSDIVAATNRPSFTFTAPTFPQLYLGQPAVQRTMVIRNNSSIPMEISSAGTTIPDFSVTGSVPVLPASIQPGDSVVLTLTFNPSGAGTFTDSVVVISRKPCFVRMTGLLKGVVIPRAIVQTVLSAGTLAGKPDDVVRIPLTLDKDVIGSEVTSWSGSLAFNRSMLHPLRVVTAGTLSEAMPNVAMIDDRASGSVRLSASGAPFTGTSRTLCVLECRVLIGDATSTAITPSADFSFLDGYAEITGKTAGTFQLTDYCMPSTRLTTARRGFFLAQNSPNPVAVANGTTTISYSLARDAETELVLHDALGRAVRTIVSVYQTAGSYEVRASLDGLPAGVYVYTLRSGGEIASRTLVVAN